MSKSLKSSPNKAKPPAAARPPVTARPPAANPPRTTSRPPVATKATPPGYVHFSDRMTEALSNIGNVIDENKSTLDSIQDMAVELTRTVRTLRAVVMKYVDMADNVLETIVPIIENLPIVPDSVKEFAKDALALSKKISAASELAEKVLPGVEASLTKADIGGLQTSTGDVAKLTKALADILPAGNK